MSATAPPDRLPSSVRPLVARLAATPGVRRVLLFGSRARGDHAPRADVDLALDAPDLAPADWHRLCADADDADTLYRVDLVRLDAAPPALRARINAEGLRV